MAAGSPRLAIVDDEPFMCELLTAMLQPCGVQADVFYDGSSFLAGYAPGAYDQVVLDLSLPDVDGFELLERMARKHTQSRVLLISGHAPATVTAAMLYAQGLGFKDASMLCKPFSRMELLLALRLSDAAGPADGKA